jgi:ABC-type transport system involved in multi-copper enzyme maturation permease subunit
MNVSLIYSLLNLLNPARLTGPIFDKELRVSSRRKRNYFLRMIYILILAFLIFLIWSAVVSTRTNVTVGAARMAEAGKIITSTIIWYQFLVLQLVAVIMLSTSISDEIYHKTLGLLMTTPITSFQIVCGKLFSRLLQLFLLLAISFPLLALLRVLGGVPWSFCLSSFCIIFTAVLFAGALSLYFSISSRHAYVVILKTGFLLAVLYFFIPFFISAVLFYLLYPYPKVPPISQTTLSSAVMFFNPFFAMSLNTARALAQLNPFPVAALWPLHCAVMLFLTLLVLARTISVVRKVALRQATGQAALGSRRKIKNIEQLSKQSASQKPDSVIRTVTGPPLVWKELMSPLIEGGKKRSIIALVIGILALLITYYSNFRDGALRENFAHVGYSIVFVLLGLITNIALSATSITAEKESSTWPILLTTPLTDWQIIIGKAVGSLRRCIPFWLFLAGHLVLFTLAGYIHPVAFIHLAMIIAGLLVFLNGTGLYFSSRLKHTTAAVVANFALVLFLWLGVPLMSEFIAQIIDYSNLMEITMSANPIVQTAVVMTGDSGTSVVAGSILSQEYSWPFAPGKSFIETTGLLFVSMIAYAAAGLLFAWRAKCRLRRNLF